MDLFSQPDRLTLFRLLVEQANVVAAARRETSRFFLTFNTAAFGALGFAHSHPADFPKPLLLFLLSGLAFACLFWIRLLLYYGRIVAAKFAVIMEVEKHFEIQPFALEEQYVWKGRPAFLGATIIEGGIPLLFLVAYVAFAVIVGLQIDWLVLVVWLG